jgi:hypothetical protein
MKREKLEKLFELAEELYREEQIKSGMVVLPYAWAETNGRLLVFSVHSTHSTEIKAALKGIK